MASTPLRPLDMHLTSHTNTTRSSSRASTITAHTKDSAPLAQAPLPLQRNLRLRLTGRSEGWAGLKALVLGH